MCWHIWYLADKYLYGPAMYRGQQIDYEMFKTLLEILNIVP